MKLPARIISQGGENLHIAWESEPINPGDEIIDILAFRNKYKDSIRICESLEDAIYCRDSKNYKKLICGPEKIGYFMFHGIVNHDRAIMYLDGYTVEELHPNTILEILSSNGECEIQIHDLATEGQNFIDEPFPFLVHDKVLIHKKKIKTKK